MINRRTFLSQMAGAAAGAAVLPSAALTALRSGAPADEAVRALAPQMRYKVAADLRSLRVSHDAGVAWQHALRLPPNARLLDIQRQSAEDRLVFAVNGQRATLRSRDGLRWFALPDDARIPDTGDGGQWIGQLAIVGFNFAPRDWAACDGALQSIAQNTALFALLGTMYGGDGRTTFALPDLRGRVPIHIGNGPGLSGYSQGQMGGSETAALLSTHLPAHSHTLLAASGRGTSDTPAGNSLAADAAYASFGYSSSAPSEALQSGSVGVSGSGLPFNVLQPYLALNVVIALFGLFPSRN